MVLLFYLDSIFIFLFSCLLPVNNFNGLSCVSCVLGITLSFVSFFFTHKFIKTKTLKHLAIIQKISEYFPYLSISFFIMSRVHAKSGLYVLDMILALYWIFIVVYNQIILFRLNPKRIKKYFDDIPEPDEKKKRSLLFGIIDWADAILQAACIVLLFNVFILQLYIIPSESMVSEFMVNDRVMGLKISAGPTFPLSSFRFPQIHKYQRGDVVIIRHPHYKDEPYNDLKFLTSQFIQMMTLTMVNINKDQNGNIKPDPLVKRIVGMGGEKVMLVDGKLYIKKKGEADFNLFDESAYAKWDLSKLPKTELQYVQEIKVKPVELEKLESVESWRSAVDFEEAIKEAEHLIKKMKEIKGKPDTVFSAKDFLNKGQYLINNMAKDNDVISAKILTTNGGLIWFENFLTGWKSAVDKNKKDYNLYELRNAQLNVLIKLAFGKLFIRNAELYKENSSEEKFVNDKERQNIINELEDYIFYLMWSRQRNMNEFPEEDEYIPDDAYFMMGDNRFNSTDMRHQYNPHLESLCEKDPYTIMFITNVKPQYIKSSQMLGTVNLILFPFSRFGKIN